MLSWTDWVKVGTACALSLGILLGNSLTIAAIWTKLYLKRPQYVIIFSLAVSDILFGGICVELFTLNEVKDEWPFRKPGFMLWKMVFFSATLNSSAATVTLLLFRIIGNVSPQFYKKLTFNITSSIMALVGVFSVLAAISQMLFLEIEIKKDNFGIRSFHLNISLWGAFICDVVTFWLPGIIIFVFYVIIICTKSKEVKNQQPEAADDAIAGSSKSTDEILKVDDLSFTPMWLISFVVVSYFGCWAPYHLENPFKMINIDLSVHLLYSYWFFIRSLVNPLWYIYSDDKLKTGMKSLLQCKYGTCS